jgi:hypothetical protein
LEDEEGEIGCATSANRSGDKMPAVTRTLHPLPFEHLEPKRFKDLVRHLAYEFCASHSQEVFRLVCQ